MPDAGPPDMGGGGSGETKYARPCRPVKPLLIIWLERQRSAPQRMQRREDACEERQGGWDMGEDGMVEEVEACESVLDLRELPRRNGIDGRR